MNIDREALDAMTPGPWNVLIDETLRVRDSCKFGTIATMGHLTRPHQGPRRDFDEVRANARAIASLPALWAAFKELEANQDAAVARAVADEREACAAVCDAAHDEWVTNAVLMRRDSRDEDAARMSLAADVVSGAAAAIRARGEGE